MVTPLGRIVRLLTVVVAFGASWGARSVAWGDVGSGGGGEVPGGSSGTAARRSGGGGKIAVGTIGPASLAADLRIKLEEGAAAGLAASGANVVTAVALSRARLAAGLGTCADSACERRLAQIADARYWLRGTCQLDTSTYRIRMELVDAESGAVVAARDDTCDICTEADAADLVSVAASTLKSKLARSQPGSDPSQPGRGLSGPKVGSGVALSEAGVDEPPAAKVSARTVSGAAGGDAAASRDDGKPLWRKVVPWLAFTGAAAAIGLGVYYLAIDGNGTDCDTTGHCQRENNTLLPRAIPLFGLGALLTTGGIIVLTLSSPTPPLPGHAAENATVPPARIIISLTGVGVTGQF